MPKCAKLEDEVNNKKCVVRVCI